MALVHDIVEIDAGDTFAYDDADGAATKQAREEAAADRLFGLLPAATGRLFRELWDEYERGDTAEARFVMAIDRMAPMMLNLAEGASTWREHGISRSRVIARNGAPHREVAARRLAGGARPTRRREPRPVSSTRRDRVHRQFTGTNGPEADPLGTLDTVTTELLSDLHSDPERLVVLEAVHNFRDLGGYATADGRTTRMAQAVPSRRPVPPDAGRCRALEPLGLRTVIDLRSAPELDERGRFPVDAHPGGLPPSPDRRQDMGPRRRTRVRPRRGLPHLGLPRHAGGGRAEVRQGVRGAGRG